MAETAKELLTRPEVRFWLAIIVLATSIVGAFVTQTGRINALEATDVRLETEITKTEPILLDIQTRLARIQAQLELILEGRLETQ